MRWKQIVEEQNFLDFQHEIHYYANLFGRHRLDPDELRSAAYLGFIQASRTYRPLKSSFKTWLRHKIASAIKDEIRKKELMLARERFISENEDFPIKKNPPMHGSEKAEEVIRLCHSRYNDIIAFAAKYKRKPDGFRAVLKRILTELGWSHKLIACVFVELQQIVSGRSQCRF